MERIYYSSVGEFEVLIKEDVLLNRGSVVSLDDYKSLFNNYCPEEAWNISQIPPFKQCSLIHSKQYLQQIACTRGFSHETRSHAYLYLLDIYPINSTALQRHSLVNIKINDYNHFKSLNNQIPIEITHLIEKDIQRTDQDSEFYNKSPIHTNILRDILKTYAHQDPEIGYVQGMSDIASLVLLVNDGNEYSAYWTFHEFMKILLRDNFKHDPLQKTSNRNDQAGMRYNLSFLSLIIKSIDPTLHSCLTAIDSHNFFYTFRWFLVCFRREFNTNDVLMIWDCIISQYKTREWMPFIAAGILLDHREAITRNIDDPDEIFKYVQDLSMNLSANEVLKKGYLAWKKYHDIIIINESV